MIDRILNVFNALMRYEGLSDYATFDELAEDIHKPKNFILRVRHFAGHVHAYKMFPEGDDAMVRAFIDEVTEQARVKFEQEMQDTAIKKQYTERF